MLTIGGSIAKNLRVQFSMKNPPSPGHRTTNFLGAKPDVYSIDFRCYFLQHQAAQGQMLLLAF